VSGRFTGGKTKIKVYK